MIVTCKYFVCTGRVCNSPIPTADKSRVTAANGSPRGLKSSSSCCTSTGTVKLCRRLARRPLDDSNQPCPTAKSERLSGGVQCFAGLQAEIRSPERPQDARSGGGSMPETYKTIGPCSGGEKPGATLAPQLRPWAAKWENSDCTACESMRRRPIASLTCLGLGKCLGNPSAPDSMSNGATSIRRNAR